MTRLVRYATLVVITIGSLVASAQDSKPSAYETKADILYRSDKDLTDYARKRCRLDVYYPKDAKDFATVVWFHGGGLSAGDKEIPAFLREKRIAVVGATYRFHPQVKSPEYVEDAAAAVAWTFQNIERLGGSKEKIYVAGMSAGGYLSAMLGLDKKWLAKHDIDANDLAGLIPVSGQTITHFTIRAERGLSDRTPVVDEMAPLFHVRKDSPPMLLITGDRELEILGRYEENAYLARMMKLAGHKQTTLFELEGFNHGEVMEPALPLLLRFVRGQKPEPSSP